MGAILGMLIGGVLAMVYGGYIAAWIIRKVCKLTRIQSYVISEISMTFVGAWSITYDSRPSFWENWAFYVACAAVALPLMIIRENRKDRTRASSCNGAA